MSGISNVGVSQNLTSYLQANTEVSSRTVPTPEQPEQRAAKQEQRLGEALIAAGVDEETAETIKSKLSAAFEEGFTESNGPPDREAIKEKIDGIFAEYGLEASEFVGRPGAPSQAGPPPGSPPPGGAPPSSTQSETEDSSSVDSESEEYQTILDLLESLSEEESDPSQLAQLIVDALFGLDESA